MEFIFLMLLGLAGFVISSYILYKNSKAQPLVCHIGSDCGKVTNSKYGKTFGFDNTILGMIYYGFVFVMSLLAGIFPEFIASSSVFLGRLLISGGAALFSAYLVYIQLIVLKEFCEYCLVSSSLSIAIFLVILI